MECKRFGGDCVGVQKGERGVGGWEGERDLRTSRLGLG